MNLHLFLTILSIIILSKQAKLINAFSEITLIINGTGKQKILANYSANYVDKSYRFKIPDFIYVNNVPQNYKDIYVYNLSKQINEIRIVWEAYIITNCTYMFYYLGNIIKIDLSKFNSSEVKDMSNMFNLCNNLNSLVLDNFNTSKVVDMKYLFGGCYSLTSINVSSFDTTKVTNMDMMFNNCIKLKSINLKNFNTSKVTSMARMFVNCQALTSLDINHFDVSLVTDMEGMFYSCTSLLSLDLSNLNPAKSPNMENIFRDCTSLIYLNIDKFKMGIKNIDSGFLSGCNPNLIYCINLTNKTYIENHLNTYYSYLNLNCNDTCFSIANPKLNINDSSCLSNCKDINKYDYENVCYDNCPENTYEYNNICYENPPKTDNISIKDTDTYTEEIKDTEKIKETEELEDNNDIDSSVIMEMKSISDYDAIEFFNLSYLSRLYSNYTGNIKDEIKNIIQRDISNNLIDTLFLGLKNNEKNYLLFQYENVAYQILSSNNLNYNINNSNLSRISLGKCEEKLREEYKLDDKIPLLIFKIDIFDGCLNIPIVEYEVYNSENKVKLDLNKCKDLKIEIYIPVIIDESFIDQYNKSSDYYKDICYKHTTKNNTDIVLFDRKNEYNNNNMSLCEKNCELKEYNKERKVAKCECVPKEAMSIISEIELSKNLFLNNFINIKKQLNLFVLKCFHTTFTKEGIKHNIGFYVLLSIILITLICEIVLMLKGISFLFSLIDNIIPKDSNSSPPKIEINKKKKESKKQTTDLVLEKNNSSKSNLEIRKLVDNINIKIPDNNYANNETYNINVNDYNDYELNDLSYTDAIKYDKRTFLKYYISLLKRKQIIIFSFYTSNDYNLKSIKISLLLFSFSMSVTINALFFTDEVMHKIYIDYGKYNFIYQLPQIIYSTIITSIITVIIQYLSLSEKQILKLKKDKSKDKAYSTKKFLILKFNFYFKIILLFLFMFWYYLSCFCAIYQNTQIALFKNTLINFALSLVYPFGLSLLPGAFRNISLRNNNKEFIYKISKIIQLI